MANRKDHAFDFKKAPKDIVPGDVIYWGKAGKQFALVVSNEYPAASVPMPAARKYCEPGLVILAHVREDLWVETSDFTYACLDIKKRERVVTSLRIQYPAHTGKFLAHNELVGVMARGEEQQRAVGN